MVEWISNLIAVTLITALIGALTYIFHSIDITDKDMRNASIRGAMFGIPFDENLSLMEIPIWIVKCPFDVYQAAQNWSPNDRIFFFLLGIILGVPYRLITGLILSIYYLFRFIRKE